MIGVLLRSLGMSALAALLVLPAACGKGPAPDDLVEGRFFPAFELRDFAGGSRQISDYRGKVVILNVWATWCPPCRKELPSLQRLQTALGTEHYAVLGLSVDADADIAQEYLLERGIRFENFLDIDGVEVRRVLGVRAYPDTFIISPDGVLLRGIVGDRVWDDPAVVRAIEAVRTGDVAGLGDI